MNLYKINKEYSLFLFFFNIFILFTISEVLDSKEIEVPFPEINLDIDISTDASENDLIEVQKQLGMYCPIAKVIRNAGTKINESWTKIN